MIRNLDNGTRLVQLGLGTTQVGTAYQNGSNVADYICFSNQGRENGELQGDEVLIHIANFKGAVSYLRVLFDLLQTWKVEGAEEEIEKVQLQMKQLYDTLYGIEQKSIVPEE